MTLRFEHLPALISKILEERSRIEHRPVDDIALEALARGLRIPETPMRDLSDIAGTLSEEDARIIEENVKWMDEGDLATQQ